VVFPVLPNTSHPSDTSKAARSRTPDRNGGVRAEGQRVKSSLDINSS
jgi:hypothetical protein